MGTTNSVRIRLRYPDLDTFVEKFAPNVTRGGVFLASRNMQPVGTLVDFEIQLVNGEVAMAGQGKVTWVKEFDASVPNRPFGMGVQFINVSVASRPVLARILRLKGPGRGTTGAFAPLGAAAGTTGAGTTTAGTTTAAATTMAATPTAASTAGPSGRVPLPVDTNVDLGAELGVDENALRAALDRRRLVGNVRLEDDLAELMRRDPPEPATLAQALADMPRLLDSQNSRRRSTGGARSFDLSGQPLDVAAGAKPAEAPVIASSPPDTTAVTDPAAITLGAHSS